MKRIAYIGLAAAMLTGLLGTMAVAQSESLGDYARQTRKQKAEKPSATKRFDNDNLPRTDKLSVVGENPAEAAGQPSDTDNDTPAEAAANATQDGDEAQNGEQDQNSVAKAEGKPGESDKDRQQFYQDWQKKITQQKDAVDLASRELDVAQREYRLRAAAFYADAGNRLRNAGSWDKEDAQYKQQIGAKQKAVDDAKKRLDDMQEEARKAGVPSSMRE